MCKSPGGQRVQVHPPVREDLEELAPMSRESVPVPSPIRTPHQARLTVIHYCYFHSREGVGMPSYRQIFCNRRGLPRLTLVAQV